MAVEGEDYQHLSTLKRERDSLLKLQGELEQIGDDINGRLINTLVALVIINGGGGLILFQSGFPCAVGLAIAVSMSLVFISIFASTAVISFYKLERLGFSFEDFNNEKNELIEKLSQLRGSCVPPPAPSQEGSLVPSPEISAGSSSLQPGLASPQVSSSPSSDSATSETPLLPSHEPRLPTLPSPDSPELTPQGSLAPSPCNTPAPSPPPPPPLATQPKPTERFQGSLESLAENKTSAAADIENKDSAENQSQQGPPEQLVENKAETEDSAENEAPPNLAATQQGPTEQLAEKEAVNEDSPVVAASPNLAATQQGPPEQLAAAQLNPPASNEFYLRVDKVRRTFERAANSGKFQIQYKRSFWTIVVAGFIHAVAASVATGFLVCGGGV